MLSFVVALFVSVFVDIIGLFFYFFNGGLDDCCFVFVFFNLLIWVEVSISGKES